MCLSGIIASLNNVNLEIAMLFDESLTNTDELRKKIEDAYLQDEGECIASLLKLCQFSQNDYLRIHDRAYNLVKEIRAQRLDKKSGLDSFIYEYDLSSEEGITLMCLAEAFLRIPDKTTVDRLIRDKITAAEWKERLHTSDNLWVNAATWALMLTGKVLSKPEKKTFSLGNVFKKLMRSSGEPVIRKAVQQAMKVLSSQFVMGSSIESALKRTKNQKVNYTYSFDMLGEAARTREDAKFYFDAYMHAIKTIGQQTSDDIWQNNGISIKLSALHPRYEFSQREFILDEMIDKLQQLALVAKEHHVSITIDAEEANRLDLSLDIFAAVFNHDAFRHWDGLGLAVQSYQKRAPHVIEWLANIAKEQNKKIPIRLVKGAYWDSEIKFAQMHGFSNYPVFTRKTNTDVSFLACARKILNFSEHFFPQFATHNAFSVAAIQEMAGDIHYEFQCLHGMGHSLYDYLLKSSPDKINCRVYAPVGSYEDLLPYLVRRLLENGANTSFVNRIIDQKLPIEQLIANPIQKTEKLSSIPHPKIPLPKDIFGEGRKNSDGFDLSYLPRITQLKHKLEEVASKEFHALPLILNSQPSESTGRVINPANLEQTVGTVIETASEQIEVALSIATKSAKVWDNTSVSTRVDCLQRMADLLEKHHDEFMYLLISEAGKTVSDAHGEVREAIDFCRYYAKLAIEQLSQPEIMHGYTGEHNQLELHGRGAILCISPWNFPLAIFIGQVVAALVTGNSVIAKPAEQTPLVASLAVEKLYLAGIPKEVLQLLPGDGAIGAKVVSDPRIKGVMFTGSTATAKMIHKSLADNHHELTPLIAETGGQNAMLVDSSALAEQVVNDVLVSAFGSAGQRCSALRVLFLQNECADQIIKMLKGAMAELRIGDPTLLSTDIGPIIDGMALDTLQSHQHFLSEHGTLIHRVAMDESLKRKGHFFAPCAYEIESLSLLKEEVFGPILHVIRYAEKDIDKVIDSINHTQYGLTLGIHSRIDETIDYLHQRLHVGNTYVNRSTIGAVVGVQPFGGVGLSGTGPKAGGPHYLSSLCTECTLTVNTTATGGNATLMTLTEDED